jgi:magnesium transporter
MVNTLFLPELREMLAGDNHRDLAEFCEALNPARTAEFMEGLTAGESWAVLRHADKSRRAEIFNYFDFPRQVEILGGEPPAELASLIIELAADDRVDLLQEVEESRVAEILPLLPTADRRDIMRLIAFPQGTAGALMTSEVAKLSERLTIREALEALSHQAEHLETIYYIYVVDDDNVLRGVVSGRQLISYLAKPTQRISELMETDVVAVQVSEDQESVAEKVERFDLLAIPVVDAGRHLLGIITHDDVIDVLREELTEDVQRIAAVNPFDESYLTIGLISLFGKRAPWLTVLFFAALLTTIALGRFDEELKRYDWLILFIPLIISSGGNSGSQTATLVITALNRGDVQLKDWLTVMGRELIIGMLLGTFLAVLGYGIAFFMAPSPRSAIVLPLTLVSVVLAGCLAGSLLPLLFKRLGLDPALMSTPFVAGIIDILGIVIYFSVARIILA